MRALVIRQPWAWAVMEGIKRPENRTWKTAYRGPVAIIAGSSRGSMVHGLAFLDSLDIQPPAPLSFGCILGVASLTDVVEPFALDDPFAEGPYCLLFSDPVKLERPVPYKGQLGLFRLPPEALRMGSQ